MERLIPVIFFVIGSGSCLMAQAPNSSQGSVVIPRSPSNDVYIPSQQSDYPQLGIPTPQTFERNGINKDIPPPRPHGNASQNRSGSETPISGLVPDTGLPWIDEKKRELEKALTPPGTESILNGGREALQAATNSVEDFTRAADPIRKLVDLSKFDPKEIDWPNIDTPNVDWKSVDLTQIKWEEVNVFQVRWEELNKAKVAWESIKPERLNWSSIGLDSLDLTKLPPEWRKIALQLRELSKTDFKKMFEEKSKEMSSDDIVKKGKGLLMDVAIEQAFKWSETPKGLELREVAARNHPYFYFIREGVKFGKERGIIKTRSECADYTQYAVQAAGYIVQAKGATPEQKKVVEMSTGDLGNYSCNDTFPVAVENQTVPAPTSPVENRKTEWSSGKALRSNGNLVTAEVKDHWRPAPGYVWNDKETLKVGWSPGTRHRDNPHCIAAKAPNRWFPEDGYQIDPDNPEVPNVISRTLVGIGAGMLTDETGYILIQEVAKGGALELAGIPVGSHIIAVNGKTTKGKQEVEVIRAQLRGTPGEALDIEFQLPNRDKVTKRIVKSSVPSQAYAVPAKQFIYKP